MNPAPDGAVRRWIDENEDELCISALVLAELASGLEALPEGKRRADLFRRLSFLQEDFGEAILSFDEVAAWEWARYMREAGSAGHSPPLMDSLIAATARAWGLTLVTRNTVDFPLLAVINPFEA
jgi:toxin FitB